MVLKAGDKPRRLQASLVDEDALCPICDEMFDQGQPIIFTISSRPIPIHKYRCKNKYYAALYLFYNMTTLDLVVKFKFGSRSAYRIQRIARSL